MTKQLAEISTVSNGPKARDTTDDGYLNGPCPNCGTETNSEYCSACGQGAKDMKKPFLSLAVDMLGTVFAFDGRLFRTVPALLFRPGHVTRSYIDGKRMQYVPPFRMFLVASVVFFLVLFSIGEHQNWTDGHDLNVGTISSLTSSPHIDGKPLDQFDGYSEIFNEDETLNHERTEVFIANLLATGELKNEQDASDLMGQLTRFRGHALSRTEMFSSV